MAVAKRKPKEKPAYLRGGEWEVARALANLWVWNHLMNCDGLPADTGFYVYPEQMQLGGPETMNGKRIVISLSVVDDHKAAPPPVEPSE